MPTTLLIVLLSSLALAADPALSVIEKTTEENKKSLPEEVIRSPFGVSFELGLPHPIGFGFEYEHPSLEFSGALNFGSFTLPLTDTDLKVTHREATFRWHPRLNALYFGVALGRHSISGKGSDSFAGQTATITADVEATYVKPVAGWIWRKPNKNLFWGFELGVQLPLNDKFKLKTSLDLSGNAEYDDRVDEISDLAELFGSTSLISITLVKVGWLF